MNKKKVLKVLGIAAVFIVLALLVIFTIIKSLSIDKQIAEFEAKRKIPDSENAAIIYDKIAADVNVSAILSDNIYIKLTDQRVFGMPWKSKDYPEEAQFLKDREILVSMLREATNKDKCVIQLPDNLSPNFMDRLSLVSKWAMFLRFSANNNIGDGRFDEAIEKNRIMLKLADHIEQQPILVYYMEGMSVDALSLSCAKKIILDPNTNEHQLQLIEKLPIKTENNWDIAIEQILKGERYYAGKMFKNTPILIRFVMILASNQPKAVLDKIKELYLRELADKRGTMTLIGLRRYKNQNGQWPENLEQIKSFIDPNILVDPMNKGSFVYKKTDNDFLLYSKGLNGKDENGDSNSPADDWPIWPVP